VSAVAMTKASSAVDAATRRPRHERRTVYMRARFPDLSPETPITRGHTEPRSMCLDRWELTRLEVSRLPVSPACTVDGCGPAPDSHRLPLGTVAFCFTAGRTVPRLDRLTQSAIALRSNEAWSRTMIGW
jgi:hypothetical protein